MLDILFGYIAETPIISDNTQQLYTHSSWAEMYVFVMARRSKSEPRLHNSPHGWFPNICIPYQVDNIISYEYVLVISFSLIICVFI